MGKKLLKFCFNILLQIYLKFRANYKKEYKPTEIKVKSLITLPLLDVFTE